MTPAYSKYERTRDGYVISTEVERLEINTIHRFLERAYWSIGIPRAVVERAIRNSLPFGLYSAGGEQCGFARVTSDFAVFAMLSDVFVLPQHRGRGLGRWLVETALAHPDLQGLRRWLLATADAHALYRQVGFAELSDPTIFMAIERSPEKLWRQR